MKLPDLGARTYTAYLVGWSDVKNGPLVDAGIYSEPYPTSCPGRRYPRVIVKFDSKLGYQEARDQLLQIIRTNASYAHVFTFKGMQREIS